MFFDKNSKNKIWVTDIWRDYLPCVLYTIHMYLLHLLQFGLPYIHGYKKRTSKQSQWRIPITTLITSLMPSSKQASERASLRPLAKQVARLHVMWLDTNLKDEVHEEVTKTHSGEVLLLLDAWKNLAIKILHSTLSLYVPFEFRASYSIGVQKMIWLLMLPIWIII